MNCSKTDKLISPYIDGELKAEAKEAFEAHMKACYACSMAVEQVRKQHNLFAQAKQYKVPYGFSTRVMANVSAERTGWFSLTPLFARFAGAIVLLMIISIGMISGGFLSGSLMQTKMVSMTSALSLDLFDPMPPDSLGGAYFAMTEVKDEK
ncbi:MAG: zf-HC2 domain-containing protein [Nitrospirae bacterium]|nr:zf-HC2 domain-containing protein [Nitrospirota bacterium]